MTTENAPQPECVNNSTDLLKTIEGQLSTVKENVKEMQITAKEIKQAYQTYIYRSFGGGYQGL